MFKVRPDELNMEARTHVHLARELEAVQRSQAAGIDEVLQRAAARPFGDVRIPVKVRVRVARPVTEDHKGGVPILCTRASGFNDPVDVELGARATTNYHVAHAHVEATSLLILPGRCLPLPERELSVVMRRTQVNRWIQARAILKNLTLCRQQVINVRIRRFAEDMCRGKFHITISLVRWDPPFSKHIWQNSARPLMSSFVRARCTPGIIEAGGKGCHGGSCRDAGRGLPRR